MLYSLLNKNLERNFYSESTFFVKLANFPSKQSHSGSAKLLHSLGAAKVLQPLGSKSIADHFDFQFDGKIWKYYEKVDFAIEIASSFLI